MFSTCRREDRICASRSTNAPSGGSFFANSSASFAASLIEPLQPLQPLLPAGFHSPQFLIPLPFLINSSAFPLTAFQCPGELGGWRASLDQRATLDFDFQGQCRNLALQCRDIFAGFDGALDFLPGGTSPLAPTGHDLKFFTLHPQLLKVSQVGRQFGVQITDRPFRLAV